LDCGMGGVRSDILRGAVERLDTLPSRFRLLGAGSFGAFIPWILWIRIQTSIPHQATRRHVARDGRMFDNVCTCIGSLSIGSITAQRSRPPLSRYSGLCQMRKISVPSQPPSVCCIPRLRSTFCNHSNGRARFPPLRRPCMIIQGSALLRHCIAASLQRSLSG
jgi:hypothetical protein